MDNRFEHCKDKKKKKIHLNCHDDVSHSAVARSCISQHINKFEKLIVLLTINV